MQPDMKALAFAILFTVSVSYAKKTYEPTWDSLDSRPLPEWYDKSKIGIFMHWGVFSVPAYDSAWFWYFWKHDKKKDIVEFMEKNYPPQFTYADFAAQFHADSFNPDRWADLYEAAGAKYVVLVTKHHEGFTLWPSKHSWNWNAYDVGPHKDLVGLLANAIRNRTDIHFGVYHSMYEFYNPMFLQDKENNFTTQDFVRFKTMPELYELVNNYKPEVIWSDGAWEGSYEYWNSTHFLAWLYNESPVKDTVVSNDRWGAGIDCHHGGFWNCNDRYNPGKILKHKWENAFTLDNKAWTYRRDLDVMDVMNITELLSTIAETVSTGGNVLINVGPTPQGTIPPIFQERLLQMGAWLKVNGEAIYETKPWFTPKEKNSTTPLWYTTRVTSSGTVVYGILLDWPEMDYVDLRVPAPSTSTVVHMVGVKEPLSWDKLVGGGMRIHLPILSPKKMPCQWAWSLKLENLTN